MAQTAANVSAASPVATGGALVAPKGTALATDATTALNAAFKALGYLGESGLEPAGEGAAYNDVRAWGGDIVTSVLTSKSVAKWKFKLLEVFGDEVNKFVFGTSNVTVTAATTSAGTKFAILDKGDEITRRAFAFDMKFGGKKLRVLAPDAQAAITAEGPYVDGEPAYYEVELTCYPDASGVRVYRYLENDNLVPV